MFPQKNATDVLRDTSRTFYLSIIRLPPGLREAVMSSYLCLRAIDEIEDHLELDRVTKTRLLRSVSCGIQATNGGPLDGISEELKAYDHQLPEVTLRIEDWLALAPKTVAQRILQTTSAMADSMSYWVERDWRIQTKSDLDSYTFCVAGSIGLLLCYLWDWYDKTASNRTWAVSFGRGLQSVNILRNRSEDLARGVDFYPDGWTNDDLHEYASSNLAFADAYVDALPTGPARDFCVLPLALAHETLDALSRGERKVSRARVLAIVEGLPQGNHGPKESSRGSHDEEQVVLVTENDEVIGIGEKVQTHREGKLHRAFSIFVFNLKGELLLQKRATVKYHSHGLWSNTCCGHPRPGESTAGAARRRLQEEMGFVCDLKEVFSFTYQVQLSEEMSEHEYDHVLIGFFGGEPNPCKNEVDDWKWTDMETLRYDIQQSPHYYTYWLKLSVDLVPGFAA
ncbi:MAG: farnesyl-diphosphate farnesyltransferase [Blastocatellia bacterium]|jgi:farnesyl-diphosphate farnesyltransferase|nr:farnesyl-diphosphate farnesyltransferase [Blastocatellia bacterium]